MNFLELPLFQSLSDQELEQMKTSGCLRTASYKKNDIIFSTGSTVSGNRHCFIRKRKCRKH